MSRVMPRCGDCCAVSSIPRDQSNPRNVSMMVSYDYRNQFGFGIEILCTVDSRMEDHGSILSRWKCCRIGTANILLGKAPGKLLPSGNTEQWQWSGLSRADSMFASSPSPRRFSAKLWRKQLHYFLLGFYRVNSSSHCVISIFNRPTLHQILNLLFMIGVLWSGKSTPTRPTHGRFSML